MKVLIHCQPTMLPLIKELGLSWSYPSEHNHHEVDVIADDIPYEVVDNYYEDPDVQYINKLGVDYDQVNCIELV